MVDSIPNTMANTLTSAHGYTFTAKDRFSNNTNVPLPNVNPEVFIAYFNDLERRSMSAQESVRNSNARQTRITSLTP